MCNEKMLTEIHECVRYILWRGEMARHINFLEVSTFRGIRNLRLDSFADINIITGNNKSGKTSLLEILESFSDPVKMKTWIMLGRNAINTNGLSLYDRLELLFDVDDEEKEIRYSIEYLGERHEICLKAHVEQEMLPYEKVRKIARWFSSVGDEQRGATLVNACVVDFLDNNKVVNTELLYDVQATMNLFTPKGSRKNIVYVSPTDHARGFLFLSEVLDEPELYSEMLKIMQDFDDDIISINADRKNDRSTSSAVVYKILSKKHKKAIPLNLYGDGMKKALLLMSAVIKAKDGVLLLDEFETAIHTSAMEHIFKWILDTCIRLNVQVFMTSHSDEAILKVLTCSPELSKKMKHITLYKNGESTVARELTVEKAITLRKKGVELR